MKGKDTPVESFFFFNDTATTEIYTLSLHDALPISARSRRGGRGASSAAEHAHLHLRAEGNGERRGRGLRRHLPPRRHRLGGPQARDAGERPLPCGDVLRAMERGTQAEVNEAPEASSAEADRKSV